MTAGPVPIRYTVRVLPSWVKVVSVKSSSAARWSAMGAERTQTSDGLTSSSSWPPDSGSRGTRKMAAMIGAMPQSAIALPMPPSESDSCPATTSPTTEPSDVGDEEQRVRRAAHLGGEQLGVHRPDRERGRGGGDDRDRHEDPEHRALAEEEDDGADACRRAGSTTATGRRPRVSVSRPGEQDAEQAGEAGGDARGSPAIPDDEKSRSSRQVPVRELGRRRAEDVGEEADRGEEPESAPVALVDHLPDAGRARSDRAATLLVAVRLGQVAGEHRDQQRGQRAAPRTRRATPPVPMSAAGRQDRPRARTRRRRPGRASRPRRRGRLRAPPRRPRCRRRRALRSRWPARRAARR